MKGTPVERFWAKVNKNGPVPESCPELGPCWIWTASGVNGYGQLMISGRSVRAHRFSFELAFGPIPVENGTHHGVCVLHRCDVRRCVNPAHLFAGTQAENLRDMVAKGRSVHTVCPHRLARGDSNGSRLHPERLPRGDASWSRQHPERLARGERNGCAKLTEADVREMRSRRAGGELLVSIADVFGVGHSLVSRICLRKTWKHVA